jgi:serine/threonine-protein kinase RsbW
LSDRPLVLEIPASSAYLSLARSAASAVCARLGYPIDRLDDVALAVSEASALLLKDAAPAARVRISLAPWHERTMIGVDADISVATTADRPPRPTTFGWTVLASLVNNVSAELEDGIVTMRLRSRQEAVAP